MSIQQPPNKALHLTTYTPVVPASAPSAGELVYRAAA